MTVLLVLWPDFDSNAMVCQELSFQHSNSYNFQKNFLCMWSRIGKSLLKKQPLEYIFPQLCLQVHKTNINFC